MRGDYAAADLLGRRPRTARTTGGGTIAGQYGSSSGRKQSNFGRVDPFCLFAVVPILAVAGFAIWGGIAALGVPLVVIALLIMVVDSWANRPIKKSAPEYRENRRR